MLQLPVDLHNSHQHLVRGEISTSVHSLSAGHVCCVETRRNGIQPLRLSLLLATLTNLCLTPPHSATTCLVVTLAMRLHLDRRPV